MYKTVLFDLDGTLLNTIDDLGDSANRVCAAHGWPQYETAQYRYFVGNGIPKLVERFSPASCRSPEQLAATLAEFDKVYGAHMHDKTAPYPGMPALLARLKAAGVRKEGPELVSCPTCGRTRIDLIGLATQVEERLKAVDKPITVAVMGCVVNGPGEASAADVGIAGGNGEGLLFRKGEIVKKVPQEALVDELFALIEEL